MPSSHHMTTRQTPSPTRDGGEGRRHRGTPAPKVIRRRRRRRAVVPILLCLVGPRRGVSSYDPTSRSINNSNNNNINNDDGLEDDPNCYDDRPLDCPGARHRGECWTMWEATLPACRASCWVCVNATDLRLQGVAENEIRRRRAYSRIDFGPLPSFPANRPDDPDPMPPEVERTKKIVAAMDAYARQFPHPECTNARAECPYWAALDQCQHNYDYMIQECPLACRYCGDGEASTHLDCRHHLDAKGGRRRRKPLPVSHISQWKEWILASSEFRTRNVLDDGATSSSSTEWAVLIDSFASPEELSEIRSTLLDQLTLQPSTADGYDLRDTLPLHAQTDPDVPQVVRRTSTSAPCDLACILEHPALRSVLKRLVALLRVPSTAHLEKPVEFVSHGPMATFARHSDCRVHDAWKMGGYRAATAYLALDGSDAALGFPHVWEVVPVRLGQLLVWPNLLVDYASIGGPGPDPASGQGQSAAGVQCHPNMTSEVLASPGTSHGLFVHVRLYPMDESVPVACR